ncbi:invasion associated locus B family protein [Gymnodinialimonas sp. 2305UL16-5]|uniref:invasion associated locus B family protein n=1 Tax=Gymnodinialimonas mytili TaxID=3126503 RepID=UPI0030A55E92
MRVFMPLAAALVLLLPHMVSAQDESTALPGRADVEPGEPYVDETFRDWQIRCIRSQEDDIPERCEMFQLLEEENGNPVAEFRISVAIEPSEDVVANATIVTPLDTLLSPGLQLQIDDGQPAVVPYAFCQQIGCFVQLSLSADDINAFQNGGDAPVTLVALVRGPNGQMGGAPVPTNASLRGFTAAYENLEGRIGGIREFIAEQEAAAAAEGDAEGETEGAATE